MNELCHAKHVAVVKKVAPYGNMGLQLTPYIPAYSRVGGRQLQRSGDYGQFDSMDYSMRYATWKLNVDHRSTGKNPHSPVVSVSGRTSTRSWIT